MLAMLSTGRAMRASVLEQRVSSAQTDAPAPGQTDSTSSQGLDRVANCDSESSVIPVPSTERRKGFEPSTPSLGSWPRPLERHHRVLALPLATRRDRSSGLLEAPSVSFGATFEGSTRRLVATEAPVQRRLPGRGLRYVDVMEAPRCLAKRSGELENQARGEPMQGFPTTTVRVALLAGVLLAACNGQETVNGSVIDVNGQHFAGETVLISSGTFKRSAVTDADGAFSVPNVPTPYNATIVNSAGQFAIEYQGLTRPDPTLRDEILIASNRRATLAGQLTGGNYPEPPDYDTAFAFESPQTLQQFGYQYLPAGSYTLPIQWTGPTTTTGVFYALQIHRVSAGSALPADYSGYGTLSSVVL
jgi:hypothetical protein